jgi:Cytochrome c554 and c-prime
MMRLIKVAGLVLAFAALLTVGSVFSASWYYTSQHGAGCASCHEMTAYVGAVHSSAHRTTTCLDCHEASLSTKLRHIRVHLFGGLPETIHLRDVDVVEMTVSCQRCHQREYATWHAGPHSATYKQILTDPEHNAKRRLNDDCLRCHAMHFNGGIRELVEPQNSVGPWRLMRADLGDQAAIPCLACHQLHREGAPESKPAVRISVSSAAMTNSLAFFDRREQMHFAVGVLALPQIWDGARPVKVSPDDRQALCYQCHAPRQPDTGTPAAANHWGPQVASGDDRTPVGVHEGISCLACHSGHNENVRASCKTCHPQMSHCGIDVETMDTTYANPKSSHNIHWVRCTDCHQHGVPKMKTVSQDQVQRAAAAE